MDNFKSIIAKRRKELKMTQRDLAEKLNVSDKTISKWETGGSYPDISMLTTIAKVLEIEVTELLGAEDMKEKQIEIEQYDYNVINKFKTKIIIVFGLTIMSIIIFLLGGFLGGDAFIITTIISITILLSAFILLAVAIHLYRSFYRNRFHRKEYDIAFYNYISIYIHLFAFIIFGIPGITSFRTIPIYPAIFALLIINLLKKSNLKIKNLLSNKIMITISILLFILDTFLYVSNIIRMHFIIVPILDRFYLFISYILFLIVCRRIEDIKNK